KTIEVDLALITYYDQLLRDVELTIVKTAKHHDAHTLYLLQTVPGIGKILSLVLLYEIHQIDRFPRVQDFASYCRLVKCAKESAGEGVSDLLILHQTDTPNSYRLIKRPITKSCMRSVLEKQIVRRTNRLIRVRKLMCLLSIFWVFAFPTVCCSASTCRS